MRTMVVVVVILQSLKYDEDNSRNNRSCSPTPNSFQTSRGSVLRGWSHSPKVCRHLVFCPGMRGREQEQPAMPHPHGVAVPVRGNLPREPISQRAFHCPGITEKTEEMVYTFHSLQNACWNSKISSGQQPSEETVWTGVFPVTF